MYLTIHKGGNTTYVECDRIIANQCQDDQYKLFIIAECAGSDHEKTMTFEINKKERVQVYALNNNGKTIDTICVGPYKE